MAAGVLTDQMDGLSALLAAASVAPNNFPWPVDSITVPCTVVGYPSMIGLGITYGRGADAFTYPIWHIVGRSNTIDARDNLSAALTGAASVWTALTGKQTFGANVVDVMVHDPDIATITVSGVEYIGLKFLVEVI